jgi:hypothetical protein
MANLMEDDKLLSKEIINNMKLLKDREIITKEKLHSSQKLLKQFEFELGVELYNL